MSRIGFADGSEHPELVAAIREGRDFVPNVFRAMLHSPDMTDGWVALANTVRSRSTLDLRTRELVILLVARLHESDYEWGHHAAVARRIGITETELDRLARWPDGAAEWDAGERAVLTFATATATRAPVPDGCVDELVETRGRRAVVDLAVTAAYYVAVAHLTHALGVRPDHQEEP